MRRWTHHSRPAGPRPTRVEPLIRNWGLRPRILHRARNEDNDQPVCKCPGIAQISRRLLRRSCVPGSLRFGDYAHGNGPCGTLRKKAQWHYRRPVLRGSRWQVFNEHWFYLSPAHFVVKQLPVGRSFGAVEQPLIRGAQSTALKIALQHH